MLSLWLAAGFTAVSASAVGADSAALDKKAAEMIKHDFKEKGIAKLDRLNQDAVQAACDKYSNKPPHEGPEGLDTLEKQQMATIKWPTDGKFMGDWKKGEVLAQSGRGMTWRDKPGDPNGGNCYNCHQLKPQELAFGTIGPSLLQYGKVRGNTPETQKYTYGKIYNAKAYNLCSNMPRFGHFGVLTEDQIKDLVALLLDPESPVNKK
jgi:sulfur-oxidizing protein SoxX